MPFLAPFIPALISGGASIGAGLLGSRQSGETRRALSAQEKLMGVQTESAQQGLDYARDFQPFAMNFLKKGGEGLGSSMDYWSRILSGRDQATSLLAPEISQITQGFRGARESSRTLNPRGGGSSAMTRRIDEEVVPGQIGGLLATARPTAATNVRGIGESLANLGLNTGNLSSNFLRGAGTGASEGILNYGLNRNAQQYEQGSGIGKSLFEILKLFNFGGGGAGTNLLSNFSPTTPDLPIAAGPF